MLLFNCKLKQQDTAIYLLEWPKFETLTMMTADKDVAQQELAFIADQNAK